MCTFTVKLDMQDDEVDVYLLYRGKKNKTTATVSV